MLFLLYKLRNAFLVTNDLSGADLVHADFCQTKKNARTMDWVYLEMVGLKNVLFKCKVIKANISWLASLLQ